MSRFPPFGRGAMHSAYQRATGKPLSPRERKGLESVLNELTHLTAQPSAPPRLPPVHTSSTQRGQTMNLYFVMAIAVVSAAIGALFGGLALHP